MLGKLLDIDRKDLSWISAYDFKECFYLNNEQMGKKLNAIIVNNKKHYDKYLNAILPDVILILQVFLLFLLMRHVLTLLPLKRLKVKLLILNLKQMKTLWTRLL